MPPAIAETQKTVTLLQVQFKMNTTNENIEVVDIWIFE